MMLLILTLCMILVLFIIAAVFYHLVLKLESQERRITALHHEQERHCNMLLKYDRLLEEQRKRT